MDLPAPHRGRPAAPPSRPTDQARRTLRRARILLGTVALVVAVPVGLAVARDAVDDLPRTGTDVSRVEAEVLAPGPAAAVAGSDVPTSARWTAPDGTVRTGLVWAGAGLPVGSRVSLSLDATGFPASRRIDVENPRVTGLLAASATVLGCWTLLAMTSAAANRRLDTLDAESWAVEWERVEPIWSGRAEGPPARGRDDAADRREQPEF